MLLCLPHQVWTLTPSPEPFWETLGVGENPTKQPKIYWFPPPEKFPLNKSTSPFIKVVIPSPSNSNFHVRNRLTQASFAAAVITVISFFFLPSAFMFTHVSLPWQKHWMVKIPPSKICTPPTFQCYLENPASLNACFNLFPTAFFISRFIKFHMTLLQLWFRDFDIFLKQLYFGLFKKHF